MIPEGEACDLKFQKPKYQIGVLIYLVCNILFLLPILLFDIHGGVISFNETYLVCVTCYNFYLITYIHILLCVFLIVSFIKQFNDIKGKLIIIITIIIITIDIFVNIWWIIRGHSWTVQ